MTIEVPNIILDAKDKMNGVEIALIAVTWSFEKRVEELEPVLEKKKGKVR